MFRSLVTIIRPFCESILKMMVTYWDPIIKVCLQFVPVYTGCPRRNVPDFGRMFLELKYTDITQKLNGYGDNGERKVWSSCGSTYSTWFA